MRAKLAICFVTAMAVMVGSAGAVTVQQLQGQASAAQPAANAQVASAAASGSLPALVAKLATDPPNAYGGPSPQDYALGLALKSYTATGTSSGTSPGDSGATDPMTSSANRCYNVGSHVWSQAWWTEAGAKVAWIEKDHNYWCGDGYQITSNGIPGYYHKTWVQFPFCLTAVSNATGWDAPHHQWAHSGIWGKLGLLTPWFACSGYSSGNAVKRIAANGYDDAVRDF